MTQPNQSAVTCPSCGLTLAPRMPILLPRHCPRCLARKRTAVELQQRLETVAASAPAPAINLDQPALPCQS
jgi:hypothetical protein